MFSRLFGGNGAQERRIEALKSELETLSDEALIERATRKLDWKMTKRAMPGFVFDQYTRAEKENASQHINYLSNDQKALVNILDNRGMLIFSHRSDAFREITGKEGSTSGYYIKNMQLYDVVMALPGMKNKQDTLLNNDEKLQKNREIISSIAALPWWKTDSKNRLVIKVKASQSEQPPYVKIAGDGGQHTVKLKGEQAELALKALEEGCKESGPIEKSPDHLNIGACRYIVSGLADIAHLHIERERYSQLHAETPSSSEVPNVITAPNSIQGKSGLSSPDFPTRQ